MKTYPDYILYRGSRDELNLLCREKDDKIEALKETINKMVEKINETEILFVSDYDILRSELITIASELDNQTGEATS